MTAKIIFLGISVLALAACSTTPPVQNVPSEPIAERMVPAPEPATPAPVAPVTENLLPRVPPPYTGPPAGTSDEFKYLTGGDGRVYFEYNQYDLSPGARDLLRRQAEWLMRYPQVTAVVEGNADERGTREYNLALGARRAESVKSFLVSLGVTPSRLTTVSYGKERPIDARSTEDGWAANRNGHTNLMSGTIG
ncbi:MAG: peptidoglycan-associated lipoprotein Pal [Alphaproteobacteria bacterium]